MSMFKQLFQAPPPNAVENLLTPQRKFLYGLIAFGPGTVLGLYLHSVKREMDRENERLRMEAVSDELAVKAAKEQKDLILMQMIDDLRARVQELEEQTRVPASSSPTTTTGASASKASSNAATTNKHTTQVSGAAKAPGASAGSTHTSAPTEAIAAPPRRELPAFLGEWREPLEPWVARFDDFSTQLRKLHEQFSAFMNDGDNTPKEPPRREASIDPSGISERIRRQQREMVAEDVKAYRAGSGSPK